jgi:hypothetical protein
VIRSLLLLTFLVAACGDNEGGPIEYSNPSGGKLRLVKSQTKPSSEREVVLDLVVGDQPLTGYSVGFNLPVTHGSVRLIEFIPGTVLDPGTAPPATQGVLPSTGPLADNLVTGISQQGAATDATLAPKSVLYTVRLQISGSAPEGIVFDGTAADFHLPSGGMRDRTGTTVVEASDVHIGKLEINK